VKKTEIREKKTTNNTGRKKTQGDLRDKKEQKSH
jgi:hypothetical protein